VRSKAPVRRNRWLLSLRCASTTGISRRQRRRERCLIPTFIPTTHGYSPDSTGQRTDSGLLGGRGTTALTWQSELHGVHALVTTRWTAIPIDRCRTDVAETRPCISALHRGNETGRERHAPTRRRGILQRGLTDPAAGRSRAIARLRRSRAARDRVVRARSRLRLRSRRELDGAMCRQSATRFVLPREGA
jgi:hypothetical protein